MTTALDVIRAAMRKIGLLASGQEPSANEAKDALECLNDMLASWEAKGVYGGFPPLSLTDPMPLEDKHIAAVKAMLAVSLADEFGAGAALSPNVKVEALTGWQGIRADFLVVNTIHHERITPWRYWR
ncbi:hypothetical protein KGP36_07175 [Patescibacteria group bacterium]|nr:hypothetical protein [Patescibacteria group bacterium]